MHAVTLFLLIALPLAAQRGGTAPTTQPSPPPGDAANGKALVTASKCLDCHRIGEAGSRMGPDLSEIGTLRAPEELRRALVAPDANVLPQHRQVRLVTKDGTSVTGRLLNQDTFSIQLIDSRDALRSYQKSDLREHTILQKGLMPSFDGKLTPQQILDIVNYLASLKGAEQ